MDEVGVLLTLVIAPLFKIILLYLMFWLIAVLTGTGGLTSKLSLIVRFTVSGRVPCSGASAGARNLT